MSSSSSTAFASGYVDGPIAETLHDVVLGDRDVDRLQERPRFGIVAQTTQPVERLYRIAALVRRFLAA